MGLNVDKVFRFIQFVANKESKGWISPSEFNLAAELAQLTLYSEKEAVFMATKKIGADMLPFSAKAAVTPATGGIITYPVDFRHLIAIYNTSTFKKYEELTQAELADAMQSRITTPTAAYPAVVQRDVNMFVYPSTVVTPSIIEYLRKPTIPAWGFTVVNSRPVYASGTSVNFDFDDILFLEISMRVLQHVGLSIKDNDIAQYGMSFSNNKTQQ